MKCLNCRVQDTHDRIVVEHSSGVVLGGLCTECAVAPPFMLPVDDADGRPETCHHDPTTAECAVTDWDLLIEDDAGQVRDVEYDLGSATIWLCQQCFMHLDSQGVQQSLSPVQG